MNNQQPNDITQKIAWTVRNFSTLKIDSRHRSGVFTIGHCNWKIVVNRGQKDGKFLAIYLEVAHPSSLPLGWSIRAEFTLTVVNQSSREESITKVMNHKFHGNSIAWGSSSFMRLKVLEKQSSGFIFEDICIVEVEFHVVEPNDFELGNGGGDVMVDFKGLGRIKKPFVPLLDEVFLRYPSLLDYKKNRSRWFTEWAFNVLGRVLQFLKEKKWKDMMDRKTRRELRHLWEELEMMSGLDLSWLEPNVKSALNMTEYETKADIEKKLKQCSKALKTEAGGIEQLLKTMKDIENELKGFKEKNLDATIGY